MCVCVCVCVCVFYSEGACLLLWSLYAYTLVCLFLCPFSCWNLSDNCQVWDRDLKLFNFLAFPLGFSFCFVLFCLFCFVLFFTFYWSIVDFYNVVLVSGIQQSESVIHMHISTLS